MAAKTPKRWWRITRACLRGMRVGLLLLIFFIVFIVGWLNFVGLPDFLKRPLVAELHARGLDLQFQRLRWRWNRGIVAEGVRVGAARQETNSPQLSIHELEIKMNHHALARFKLHTDSVIVQGGQLVWPLNESNQPPASLSMSNIQTQLRFLPGDQWALDHFTAGFAGAKLQLTGSLTNASALRNWKIFRGHAEAQPEQLRARLRELARVIDQIKFVKPPELNLAVYADARDVRTFNGLLKLDAPDAATPWGALTNGTLLVRLTAPTNLNGLPTVKFRLHTDEVKFAIHTGQTQALAGGTRHFQVNLEASGVPEQTNLVEARLEIFTTQFTSPWGHAASAQFTAHWTHSLTNPVPNIGTGELLMTDAQTRWGSADRLHLNARLTAPPTNRPPQNVTGWGWWTNLEPYFLDWNCRVENIHADEFVSKEVLCGGNWRAPELTITNLHTEMYQGRFNADARLNVATRLAAFACASDFDVQKAYPLLSAAARDWLKRQDFSWEKPPLLHANGSVVLPEWTDPHPDWHKALESTLSVSGDFQVGAAAFHNLPVTSAHSHLTYSNQVINLPDLVVIRPEGEVQLALVSDAKTKGYYFRIRSTVDVKVVRPLLETTNAQRVLDSFTFTQPPLLEAEVWGYWRNRDSIGLKGQVTLTNFVARGETATFLHTFFEYTNLFILAKDIRLERTNQYLTASSMGFDLMAKKAFLTNGFSTVEPTAIVHTIGPKVTKDIEPYHFLKPPSVHASGVIPLSDDISVADLHFKVDGGPFEWDKFHMPHVSGTLDWVGQLLTLSQMNADFYGGKLTGTAGFDFKRKVGADFHFDVILTGANLHSLMTDLTTPTNHLEGVLNGHLDITNAQTQDPHSWFGKGQVDLHDGLIWDIPLFGILSPVLDYVSPGLGKTRITDGTATFTMTNSVIRSDDLQLRSPTIRLYYNGIIDAVTKQVDARVSAEVGRDTPVVGPLVGTLSAPFGKLFETRLTGSLTDPKREPVFFMLRWLNPFNWLRNLKELLPGNSDRNPPAENGAPNIQH